MKEYDETKYKLVPIEEDDMNDIVDNEPEKKPNVIWLIVLVLLIGLEIFCLYKVWEWMAGMPPLPPPPQVFGPYGP
jgi:hypothetical protein